MDGADPGIEPETPMALQGLIFVSALAVMAGLMYYSYDYTYPDGKQLQAWDFCIFWAREIFIFAIGALVVLIGLVAGCIRRARRLFPGLRKPL
jgi:hypothetical protein